ncbi:MAG: glutamine--fructose-6-phosphate aminotransferase [Desulfitibacter sp. BRH_c19]|nr:MAG: glutamine--fructose-6-phosphate aminotransferase [Desulfitibacter sp. BRH_c19]
MCGIVGYIGKAKAVPILVEGLKKLEYRGYDSAGLAVLENSVLEVVKTKGKMKVLEEKINGSLNGCNIGIGHTRWATHGKPSDTNSHPHKDCSGKLAVVHNGIIENYQSLKEWLQEKGHRFVSETDTEVLPHIIEEFYSETKDLLSAIKMAAAKIEGSYAMVVLCKDYPGEIFAARKDSPLIVGLGEGENFFASDIPAILNHTRRIYILDDGEIARISHTEVEVFSANGSKADKVETYIDWDAEAAEKGGYSHFMLKEIHEQPEAVRKTLSGRIDACAGKVNLSEISLSQEYLKGIKNIAIVACGTASYAGLVGKNVIEKLTRIPVMWDIASEFRYRDPLVDEKTLMIVISQSGETADTLAALREGKQKGARVLAITNVNGSSISREADQVLYTLAGPEIAVASTKAYVTQLIAMYLLAYDIADKVGTLADVEIAQGVYTLTKLSEQIQEVLKCEDAIKEWAKEISNWDDVYFLGRGIDYNVAQEGQLKLKEISYIHAEALAAGEMKHGTIALIEDGTPVVALATQNALFDKMLSNIQEVQARGAKVTALTFEGNTEIEKSAERVIYIPKTLPIIAPVLTVVPLQLLAYYTAIARGSDVDMPRNLAKSVTVE